MSKTSYVGINNVARQCKNIYVGVNNIARKVTKAYVGDNNGKARLWWDESGIIASDLAVGDIVKLTENGTPVEYIVVNQGIPENSGLYDASCNGTWLLRKDLYSKRQWNTSDVNIYETSAINTWLNEDYFNSLGVVEQAAIKQVKIPYRKGGGYGTDQSGASGLSTKIFLVSVYELGWTTSDSRYFPVDGAKLSYFESGTSTSANSKRIAYLNSSATVWWLRSPDTHDIDFAWFVKLNGNINGHIVSTEHGIRPALILPFTAKFDKSTKILKG